MVGIDVTQTISKECPKYPEPNKWDIKPERRIQVLDTFQADAETAATWLIIDALKAAVSYCEWLEVCTQAADHEILGLHISAGGDSDSYYPADIASVLESKEMIKNAIERLRIWKPITTQEELNHSSSKR